MLTVGTAQGFAYIEFLEADAVASAVLLADTELHGRQLKVSTFCLDFFVPRCLL